MKRIVTELPYFLGFLETPWSLSSVLEHSDFLCHRNIEWSEFYELAELNSIAYEKDVSELFCGFIEECLKQKDFPVIIRSIQTYTNAIQVEVFIDRDLFISTAQRLGRTSKFKKNFTKFNFNDYESSEVFSKVLEYLLDTTEEVFQDEFYGFIRGSINLDDYINIPEPIVDEIQSIKERHSKEFCEYLKTVPDMIDDQKTKLQTHHDKEVSDIVKYFIQSYKYGEFIWNDELKGYLMKW